MQYHCHGLCGLRSEHNFRALDLRVAVLHTGSELTAHQLGNADAVPTIEAQERMRIGQGIDTAFEHGDEFIH